MGHALALLVGLHAGVAWYSRPSALIIVSVVALVVLAALGLIVAGGLLGRLRGRIARLERQLAERKQELADLSDTLREMTDRDGLTGVANRRRFDWQLSNQWGRRTHEPEELSLMLIDVDRFSAFNEERGHLPADDVLRDLGRLLERHVAASGGLVARYAGEEFAILLPKLGLEGATTLAEDVCVSIREQLPVTVSIGLTSRRREDTRSEVLVGRADDALSRAKAAGRDRVVVD